MADIIIHDIHAPREDCLVWDWINDCWRPCKLEEMPEATRAEDLLEESA